MNELNHTEQIFLFQFLRTYATSLMGDKEDISKSSFH